MGASGQFDAIVAGGGPSGAAMAWALAKRGINVAVVERAEFPREKVCGDFVEPAGLRIIERMGCSAALGLDGRTAINKVRAYYGPHIAYQNDVAYYDGEGGMPPHGHIIPRHDLDTALLDNAQAAGAKVFQGTTVRAVTRENGIMHVQTRTKDGTGTLTAPVVIGADGVQSMVAAYAGLRRDDKRHIGISQRVYLEGVEMDEDEACIWFDEDHYPGYGWVFPAGGGRANAGMGMLSETTEKFDISLQRSFRESLDRLKYRHPGCANATMMTKPLGGAVHMYGGITRNHFAGGILVGDAGGFVDPMTAEGITQGMESSIIGARTIAAALEKGSFEEADFAPFETEFRAHFDYSMLYLSFYATMMRNRHFGDFFLSMTKQGFERAQHDREFARISGTGFGGLNVQPAAIAAQLWKGIFGHIAQGGSAALMDLFAGRGLPRDGFVGDWNLWQQGWRNSLRDDPAWHMGWLKDIVRAASKLGPSFAGQENPRVSGPFETEAGL